MKRIIKVFSLLICLFLVTNITFANTDNVVDNAGLLSYDEEEVIQEKIEKLRNTYRIDFVVYTTDEYYPGDVKYDAADFYDYNGYGVGSENEGVMLYVNMYNREYFILTTGDYTIYSLTDYALDQMYDVLGHHLSNGDYYEAVDQFLDYVIYYLDYAENNGIYDTNNNPHSTTTKEEELMVGAGTGTITAAIAALASGFGMKAQMKSVRRQRNASAYADDNYSYCKANLTNVRDIFLYRTVTRTYVPKSKPSSGGGSSTFRSSSGRSHGGRGGRF